MDNIAAIVQKDLKPKPEEEKANSVSVITTKDNLQIENNDNVTTAAPKYAIQFVDVNNELEEMFAGFEDDSDPLKTDTETKIDDLKQLTTQDNAPSTSSYRTEVKKPPKKRNRKPRIFQSEAKKKIGKKSLETGTQLIKTKKSSKIEAIKDVYAYDSGSNASSSKSRGPFIQIRGPRDSPLSVSVINTPTNNDDSDRKPNKTKKFYDDSEYRRKVRLEGMHCSTSSYQYDAQTKDASWICAFCKRGPHATETSGSTLNTSIPAPGDLFGPYFITTNCPEFERKLDDPFDKQFKSKKIAQILDGSVEVEVTKEGSKEDVFLGITDTGNGTFEVWAHEECIVWSDGVYLVGPKIVGLEEAVWASCNVVCSKCHLKGANICCLKRGCIKVAHVCCARLTNWWFDEENYKTYCPEHRVE